MKTSDLPTAILAVLEATGMPLTAQDVTGLLNAGILKATLRNTNRHLLKLADAGHVKREYTYTRKSGAQVGSYYYSTNGGNNG